MQAYNLSDSFFQSPLPRPLVPVCLSMMGGIAYARFFPFSTMVGMLVIMLVAFLWFTTSRSGLVPPTRQTQWRWVLIIAALAGAIRMQIHIDHTQIQANTIRTIARMGEQTLSGSVDEIRQYESGLSTLVLTHVQFEKWKRFRSFSGKIEVRTSAQRIQTITLGDRIQFKGQVVPIQGPRVPTFFNRQAYQYSQQVFATIYLPKETPITRLAPSAWTPVRGIAHDALKNIHKQWDNPTQQTSVDNRVGVLASIGFGIRTSLPPSLADSFRRSGLAHITSISGLHVSLVLTLLVFLLKSLGLKRKQAAWIVGVTGLFYILLVGTRIPTLRAVMMTFVLLGNYFVNRRIDSLNTLALTAVILLLMHPEELFLPSFQLSFMAVLILILSTPYSAWITRKIYNRFVAGILQGVLASGLVIVGLAPFTIPYFHLFSWGAIPGNLLVIPLTAVLLPLSYSWVLSFSLPFESVTALLGFVTQKCTDLLISVIQFFAQPFFYIELPTLPLASSILLSFAFLALSNPTLCLLKRNQISIRSYHASLVCLAVALWFTAVAQVFHPLQIDFLALGQGDCMLIRTPDNRTALIDGGPPPDLHGSNRDPLLVQYLLSEGIHHIDAMMLTHPESDHIGALPDVLDRFPVSQVFEGNRQADSDAYTRFQIALKHKHLQSRLLQRGDQIRLGNQTILWVLHPGQESKPSSNPNESSLVLLLQQDDLDVLLTGDIGKETEQRLCRLYDRWDVDVIKVPHHGSNYSSSRELLDETQPEFAIIQVGRNQYGHPHHDTRYRYYDIGSHVLRTDYDGTVRLSYREGHLRMYTTRANRLYTYRIPGE